MIWFLIVLLLLCALFTSSAMVGVRLEWSKMDSRTRRNAVLGLMLLTSRTLGFWVSWHWYNILGLAIALSSGQGA